MGPVVEIRDGKVNERQINTDNGPRVIRSQQGRTQLAGESETRPVQVPLRDDEEGYAPGKYTISEESFYMGSFDKMALGRLRLKPIERTTGKDATTG